MSSIGGFEFTRHPARLPALAGTREMQRHRVAIVGGGPVGLGLALALARWGVPSGPYLVLPLIGPSSVRDTAGFAVDTIVASPLARAEWLAVGEAQGEAKGARITGAVALSEAEVTRWLAHRIEKRSTLRWVADEDRVEALLESRLDPTRSF